jgi:hypothetical protein
MKTGLHDRRRATLRDRVAPDTGPMTGSISNQQPSTIRGEAQEAQSGEEVADRRCGVAVEDVVEVGVLCLEGGIVGGGSERVGSVVV